MAKKIKRLYYFIHNKQLFVKTGKDIRKDYNNLGHNAYAELLKRHQMACMDYIKTPTNLRSFIEYINLDVIKEYDKREAEIKNNNLIKNKIEETTPVFNNQIIVGAVFDLQHRNAGEPIPPTNPSSKFWLLDKDTGEFKDFPLYLMEDDMKDNILYGYVRVFQDAIRDDLKNDFKPRYKRILKQWEEVGIYDG